MATFKLLKPRLVVRTVSWSILWYKGIHVKVRELYRYLWWGTARVVNCGYKGSVSICFLFRVGHNIHLREKT